MELDEPLPRAASRRVARQLSIACALALAIPGTARAQTEPCPAGRVGRIEVVNHSLFSPEALRGRAFEPLLRLTDRLHIRTREGYIRRSLEFAEGSCYDAEAVDAAARFLRDLNFVARAEARAARAVDSTWTVRIETWDEWSLRGQPEVDSDNDFRLSGFSLSEDNLLGTGTFFAASRDRTLRARDDRFVFGTTRLFRTNTTALIESGSTLTGRFFRHYIDHPLRSENPQLGWNVRLQQEDAVLGWHTGNRIGLTELLVPVRDRLVSTSFTRRTGAPGRLRILGAGLSFLDREASGTPTAVFNRVRAEAGPAPDSLVDRLGPQANPLGESRLGAYVGRRRLRFIARRGLDLVNGPQNVALGHEVTVTFGRSIGGIGRTRAGSFAGISAFASDTAGSWLGQVLLDGGFSIDDTPSPDRSRLRDGQLTATGRLYLSDLAKGWVTLFSTARVDWVINPVLTMQRRLGKDDRLRGYYGEQLPTGSAVSATFEPRVNLPVIHPALDLGLAVFGDVGRGWASGVPLAMNTGWRSDVGGAIRVGFPAGTGSIMRFEWAWPLGAFPGHQRTFRIIWTNTITSR